MHSYTIKSAVGPTLLKMSEYEAQRSFYMVKDYNEYVFNCWISFLQRKFANLAKVASMNEANFTSLNILFLKDIAAKGHDFCNIMEDVKVGYTNNFAPTTLSKGEALQECIKLLEKLNECLDYGTSAYGNYSVMSDQYMNEVLTPLNAQLHDLANHLEMPTYQKVKAALQTLAGIMLIAASIAATMALMIVTPASAPVALFLSEFMVGTVGAIAGWASAKNSYRLFDGTHKRKVSEFQNAVINNHAHDALFAYNVKAAR
jgi:hypothetical protein